mgnify:CR=1 FL=1
MKKSVPPKLHTDIQRYPNSRGPSAPTGDCSTIAHVPAEPPSVVDDLAAQANRAVRAFQGA